MIALDLLIAFNLGLISTVHCLAMCGPVITAYSLGLPGKTASTSYILIFNTGRISSYFLAGIICGFVGASLAASIQEYHGQMILQLLAALILISIGLHVAGWLPQFRKIEVIGLYLWKYLQPLTRQLLPVNTIPRAFAAGLIWGWLPCGLVYSVLLWNLARADAVTSGLNMLAFGFGTMPGMVAAGIAASRIDQLLNRPGLRRVLGLLVVLVGLFSAWVSFQHNHPDQHGPHSQLHDHQMMH